jgi:transposase
MVAVRKTDRREHDTPKKARFRALVEDAGWSGLKAATKVKANQSTASRWLKQASERRTGKFQPGRPKILTKAQLDRIEKWFDGYYEHRIMSLYDIIQDSRVRVRCSPSTLLRALQKRRFHTHAPELEEWLSPKNKEQRPEFALKHRRKYF